ncbi:DUF6259 domain-containing protein [Candidatus Hydrogenedentota bacterium]
MRNLFFGLTTVVCAISGRLYADSGHDPRSLIEVAAGDLSMKFDPGYKGGITSVKNGALEIVRPDLEMPTLFKIGVVEGARDVYYTNLDFKNFSWERGKYDTQLHFGELKDGRQLAITISVASAYGSIRFGCTVDCGTDMVCSEIMYPYINGYKSLSGDPNEDKYLYPHLTGEWHANPARELREKGGPFFGTQGYPGTQGVQFHSLHTKDAGVLMYTPDPECNPKWFTIHKNKKSGSMAWTCRHYFDETPGFRFKPKYEVRIQACGPSWYDSAEIYAEWGRKQWWMKKEKERPGWLDKMPLMINVYDNEHYARNEPEWIAERQEEMNKIVGPRELCHTFWSWEHYGHWVAPDSFPPVGGEEAMIAASKKIRDLPNTHLRHMFSCGKYWLHKDITDEIFDTQIMKMAVHPRGRFKNSDLIKVFPNISTNVNTCPSSLEYQAKLFHLVQKLVEYNHDFISMDIWPLGQPNPCYNKHHNHPPGLGRWYVDANIAMLKKMHSIVFAEEPAAIFGGESMAEPYLPWMHATIMRSASSPLGRGKSGRVDYVRVPMFAYIYGDKCISTLADFVNVEYSEEEEHENGRYCQHALYEMYQSNTHRMWSPNY